MKNLIHGGYRGKIYPIPTPSSVEIMGFTRVYEER